MTYYLGVDIGASSGRHILGYLENGKLKLEEIHRFENYITSQNGTLVWGMHGIYGAGKTMDEAFGLIETVEKAAQIYILTAHLPRVNTIKDSQKKELAEFFGVDYRKDFLNIKE